MAGAGRLGRRLAHLYVGLVLLGSSMAWMVEADLGLSPWDVLHQGVADRTALSFGSVVIAIGVVVMLLWIPLRQVPGLGTVSNAIVVGLAADATLAVVPAPRNLAIRGALLVSGVVANGFATALYIGARLGPGPRDGLMTGLAERGMSIRVVRTGIELGALTGGLLLGGSAGLGTVLYAVGIGPLAHFFIPRLTVAGPTAPADDEGDEEGPAVDVHVRGGGDGDGDAGGDGDGNGDDVGGAREPADAAPHCGDGGRA